MRYHDDEPRPSEDRTDAEWLDAVRRGYHPPPETPREEMWASIETGLRGVQEEVAGGSVLDMDRARATREAGRGTRGIPRRWLMAAAAVLVLGIGIGRWTAPSGSPGGSYVDGPAVAEGPSDEGGDGLMLATRLHLAQTEPLLTSILADSRSGRLDASVGRWARALLAETRLLMDARTGERDEMQRLLTDLELVLVQIVGASPQGEYDDARAREEMDLAVRSLEREELLERIRTAAPSTMSGA